MVYDIRVSKKQPSKRKQPIMIYFVEFTGDTPDDTLAEAHSGSLKAAVAEALGGLARNHPTTRAQVDTQTILDRITAGFAEMQQDESMFTYSEIVLDDELEFRLTLSDC